MKRLFILISLIFSASCLYAFDSFAPHGLYTGSLIQYATSGFTLGDGDLGVQDDFVSYKGFVVVTDVFDDVPASNTDGHFNVSVTTTILTAGTSIFMGTNITQPIIPMNVVVISSATDITAANWDYGATMTITGYDGRGETQTENIKICNIEVAGVKAWSYFSSFSINTSTGGTSGASAIVKVGVGTILGLGNHIEKAALVVNGGDIIWAQLNDSGTTATDSPTCNTTYNTWTPDTAGDGAADVYTIRYKVKKR